MKREVAEFLVGVFVLAGLLCVGYLSIKLGKLDVMASDYYTLKARFISVAGVKKGASVQISGIQVGRVTKLTLDMEDQVAVVEMQIDPSIQVGDDVIASIKTSGLIGDRYVVLTPGGSLDYLKDGDFITETESPTDLTDLIGKYAFGGAGGD